LYPQLSSYQYASNSPVANIDLDGAEALRHTGPVMISPQIQRVANEATILKLQHPTWSDFKLYAKASWNVTVGYAHDVLDVGGLVPGVGEPADFVNGVLYTLQGEGTNAALSFAGALPIAGWASTGTKWAKNALKLSDNAFHSASGLIFKMGSKHGNRLAHVLEHTADDLTKRTHGVFELGDKLVENLDNAFSALKNTKWTKQLKVGESETVNGITRTLQEGIAENGTKELREAYIIDMGKKVGYEGGSKGTGESLNKIMMVLKSGTSEVITAFSIK
jgi:hypothetical protein